MCPDCITTATMVLTGATSVGGLTAFLMKLLPWKPKTNFSQTADKEKSQ